MGNLKSEVTVSQSALQVEVKFPCSLLVKNSAIFPPSLSLLHHSNLRTIGFASLQLPGKKNIRGPWGLCE